MICVFQTEDKKLIFNKSNLRVSIKPKCNILYNNKLIHNKKIYFNKHSWKIFVILKGNKDSITNNYVELK